MARDFGAFDRTQMEPPTGGVHKKNQEQERLRAERLRQEEQRARATAQRQAEQSSLRREREEMARARAAEERRLRGLAERRRQGRETEAQRLAQEERANTERARAAESQRQQELAERMQQTRPAKFRMEYTAPMYPTPVRPGSQLQATMPGPLRTEGIPGDIPMGVRSPTFTEGQTIQPQGGLGYDWMQAFAPQNRASDLRGMQAESARLTGLADQTRPQRTETARLTGMANMLQGPELSPGQQVESARQQGAAEAFQSGDINIPLDIPWDALGFGNKAEGEAAALAYMQRNGRWPWDPGEGRGDNPTEALQNWLQQYWGTPATPQGAVQPSGDGTPAPPSIPFYEGGQPQASGGGGFGGFSGGTGGGFFGGGGGGGYQQELPPWLYPWQARGI